MSEHVTYKGRDLGKFMLNDNGTCKFVFVAEGLESLATLFSIQPDDEIETEGRGKMKYSQFQQTYLKNINAFYPTIEAWLLKNRSERTIEAVDRSITNSQ